MKRLNQSENVRPRRTLKAIKIGIAVVAVFIFLEIWLVNNLSTYGGKIAKLQSAQAAMKLENQVLENQIAKNNSLNQLEEEAEKLGFSGIKDVVYLKSSVVASAH